MTRQDGTARIRVAGDGNLEGAAAQVCRLLSLDVDARGRPDVADRDPVIATAQAQLPGLRPCGFHSPYEAAVWSVLSQRIRIVQAARLRDDLVHRHGDDQVLEIPSLPPLATRSPAVLLGQLLLSILVLSPGQPPAVRGAEIAVLGLVMVLGVTASAVTHLPVTQWRWTVATVAVASTAPHGHRWAVAAHRQRGGL